MSTDGEILSINNVSVPDFDEYLEENMAGALKIFDSGADTPTEQKAAQLKVIADNLMFVKKVAGLLTQQNLTPKMASARAEKIKNNLLIELQDIPKEEVLDVLGAPCHPENLYDDHTAESINYLPVNEQVVVMRVLTRPDEAMVFGEYGGKRVQFKSAEQKATAQIKKLNDLLKTDTASSVSDAQDRRLSGLENVHATPMPKPQSPNSL
ncbi:MAG: hypothetical protein G01um101416_487 [Microgenomates group bacterium Gr01-1014_16]|nr:MAG: hypothetical protein G01um101416_487 [Microgenomates group bacterium Gr01-1014_16]